MDLDMTIAEIREEHRTRCFAMQQRMRLIAAVTSFVRYGLGWRRDLEKQQSDDIKLLARLIVDEKPLPEKKLDLQSAYDAGQKRFEEIIAASKLAAYPFQNEERSAEKAMIKAAKSLPVYSFCENINGFGALGLAIIVGEAGDLSNYPDKGKLWKRMGVALIDGVRQGGLSKLASNEDWIKHGYVRERRSRLYTIGDSLIKKQNRYRDFYLKRKEYVRDKAEAAGLKVAAAADIPFSKRKDYMSLGHIHKDAQRVMEKRLLRDLWQAWRRCRHRDLSKCAQASDQG